MYNMTNIFNSANCIRAYVWISTVENSIKTRNSSSINIPHQAPAFQPTLTNQKRFTSTVYFNRGRQTEASLRTNVPKRKSLFAGLHYHCTVGYNCRFSEDVSFIFLGRLPKNSTGVLYSNPETKKTLCIMFPVNHWNRADTAGKGGGYLVGLVEFTDNYNFLSHFNYENYTLEFIFIIFTQGGQSFLITVSWFFETSNHSQIYGRLLRSALPHGGSTAVFKQSNLFSAHSCSFSSSLYLSNLIRSLSSPVLLYASPLSSSVQHRSILHGTLSRSLLMLSGFLRSTQNFAPPSAKFNISEKNMRTSQSTGCQHFLSPSVPLVEKIKWERILKLPCC